MQATVVRGLLIAIVVLFLGFQSKNIHSIVASAKKAVKARPIVFAYVAQVTANSCFGIGSVVGKLGLPSVNPLMFATVRECGASVLLALAAWHAHGIHTPTLKGGGGGGNGTGTLRLTMLCGLSVLLGQLLFLIGLKMSNPVSASVWQPSQPIFTLLMAAALGQEELSAKKLAGILFAFTGCVYMVLSGARSTDSHGAGNGGGASAAGGGERGGIGGGGGVGADTSDGPLHNDSYIHFPVWLPHVFFFFNCLGTPVYILASKRLMKTMPPLWVTAWSYITASGMLIVLTAIGNNVKPVLDFMCPPPDELCGNGWQIPPGAVWALAYWIVFVSAIAYALITWGNQHIPGSTVSAFFAFQPIAAAVAASLVVKLSEPPHHGLEYPGVEHLVGSLGVLGGLALIISEANASHKQPPSKGINAN